MSQAHYVVAGLIIVDDRADHQNLPRTYGTDDLPIILQDRSFEANGSLIYSPSPLSIKYGSRGDTIIVNGAISPVAKVPRGLVRLRILDAANARNFYLRFSDERVFHVIASDGGYLAAPIPVAELRISPGERPTISLASTRRSQSEQPKYGKFSLSAWFIPSIFMGRHSNHHLLISRGGRMSC
jgi:cuproxidase